MADVTAIQASNLTLSNGVAVNDSANSVALDSRRYTKFDHSATDAGEADLSFSDVLDMVNPLQHIPVVSSVYRSLTGDTINPVSRVAGDILYGGVVGAGSAIVGGLSGIGNSIMEAKTGQDITGNIVTAMFGGDAVAAPSTTELAQADIPATAASSTVTVSTSSDLLAQMTPIPKTPMMSFPAPQVAAATAQQEPNLPVAAAAPTAVPSISTDAETAAQPASVAAATAVAAGPTIVNGVKVFPLDRSKQAYGGVMDTTNSMSAQNMAMALAESSHAMHMGHTIYTGRLMTGAHPLPVAPIAPATTTTPSSAASPTPTASAAAASPTPDNVQVNAEKTPLPQSLSDDMIMLQAIGQYKGVAAGSMSSIGSVVNTTH